MASNIDRSRKLISSSLITETFNSRLTSAAHVAIDQSLREGRAYHVHVNRRRSCQKRFADACRGIGCARQPWRTHPHGLEGHGPVRVACAEQVFETIPSRGRVTRNRDLETRRHDIALYAGGKLYERRIHRPPFRSHDLQAVRPRPLVDMAVHRSVDIERAASGVDGQEDPANLWSNGNRGEHGERKLS